jgi:hypothetical protein
MGAERSRSGFGEFVDVEVFAVGGGLGQRVHRLLKAASQALELILM